MKKLFSFLMAVVLTSAAAFAQSRVVTGTVVSDAGNEPLAGATVQPVGGSAGVATDLDGRFSISVPQSVQLLRISYLGMESQEVAVKDNLEIRLKSSSTMLDAVVVTGYGSAKKLGTVVGSVSVVDEAAIENTPATTFVDALQGQVPGLAIYSNTGEPASPPSNINIRGVNSLEASNTPLFILDGAPVSSSFFTSINPADIDNITVLKDASATSIYGSRAANGVIVITTKKGRYGEQAKVTVRGSVGWSSRVRSDIDMMDSKQYLQFREEQAAAFGVADLSQHEKDLINIHGISTDWQKEMMRDNAPTYSFEAAVQGGTEKTNYYISLGHNKQEGLIARSDFQRETLRASFDTKIKEWFRVGFQANLGVEHYMTNSVAAYAGKFYINGPIVLSYAMLPYDAPYYYTFDENGKIQFGQKAEYYLYTYGGVADANFLNANNKGRNNQLSLNATLYEQFNPIKGLTIRFQQAAEGIESRGTSINPALEDYMTPMGVMTNFGSQYLSASRGESFSRRYQFTYTNTAEYRTTINDVHEITALLGQESIITRANGFSVSTSLQPNNIQMLLTNGTNVTMENVGQSISEFIMNSYFLQGDYGFDSRYFFNFTVRRDGSSKFAPGHRWATFYALGAMWNLKNEKFLESTKWLDDLKFRVNYGTTGNSGIDPYLYMGTVGTGAAYDGSNSIGLTQQSNNELTWETVAQFNVGFGYSVFNRLYGNVDYYIKDTHDMLMSIPYSVTTGWSGGMANIGSLRNTGVDFEIGSHIYQDKDWYVGARINFNYNKNTITELFNGLQEYPLAEYGYMFQVGQDPYQYYMVRYAGVDPQDGKQMWYDKDGNITKVYNENDQVTLGKGFNAPWTGGFGVNARYKGLAIQADFNWAGDKYILNCADQLICNPQYMYNMNQSVKMLDSWRYPGQVTDMPAITETIQADTRYLQNSSFIRMKNLTVSYALPKTFLQKLYLSDVIFRFTGRNLLTFTTDDYTGNDPEYVGNLVRFNYPNTRQYEFGVEISF